MGEQLNEKPEDDALAVLAFFCVFLLKLVIFKWQRINGFSKLEVLSQKNCINITHPNYDDRSEYNI